jgi:hypothetical protein
MMRAGMVAGRTAPPRRYRSALRAMYAGLMLTVVAAAAPYIDRATTHALAHHIRDGYPSYSAGRIDAAVTAWLLILSVVGAFGVVGWAWVIWTVRTGKRWALPAAATMFTLGTSVALTALLVKDTSGETGLAPALGWIGLLPCVAGVVALVCLGRRP